jgi:uncharacterized protein YjiS (DUF1127 family)
MRELVLYEALARESLGLVSTIRRFLSNRKTRNAIRLLQAMDDFQLRDIGLTRDDLLVLLAQGNDVDLLREAERLRLIRKDISP